MSRRGRRTYFSNWGLSTHVFDKSVKETYDDFSGVFGLIPSISSIRRLYRKSSILQAIVLQIGANVIGHEGPQPTFNNVAHEQDRKRLQAWWDEWQKDVLVTGDRTHWAEFLTALEAGRFMTGRDFAIARRHPDYPKGLAFMTVNRECIAGGFGQYNYQKVNGYDVINGTAYSESGRIAGYVFQQRLKPQEIAKQGTVLGWGYKSTSEPIFVPEGDVLDNRSFSLSDDWDGYPYMILPVLNQLARIFRYDNATMEGMEAAGKKMGFFEKEEWAPEIDWDTEEQLIPPPDKIEGNHIEDLPPGYKFNPFDPSVPNMDHHRQRREYIKNATSGAGVDYSTVSGDLTEVNFSSIRHGTLTSRDNYRIRQVRMGNRVVRKALGIVLDHAVSFGGLKLSRVASLNQAKATDLRFKSWEWVDPLKDAAASQILLKMGVTSPQKIASGLGIEYSSVIHDIAEAIAQLQEAGLTPEDLAALAGETQNQPDNSGQEEEMKGGGANN